jgi:hypothetical protein
MAKAEPKEPLIVGIFKCADYGFVMPKNVNGEPMGSDTELVWDFNKRYGSLSWQNKFIKAIISKGYEHVLEKATAESKEWIDKASYAVWQRKLDYSGNDADGIPGKASWDTLRVPHV